MTRAKKLTNGKWVLRVSHTENGKRVYKRFYGTCILDVERQAAIYSINQERRNTDGNRKTD